jgi:hypothetical protein
MSFDQSRFEASLPRKQGEVNRRERKSEVRQTCNLGTTLSTTQIHGVSVAFVCGQGIHKFVRELTLNTAATISSGGVYLLFHRSPITLQTQGMQLVTQFFSRRGQRRRIVIKCVSVGDKRVRRFLGEASLP